MKISAHSRHIHCATCGAQLMLVDLQWRHVADLADLPAAMAALADEHPPAPFAPDGSEVMRAMGMNVTFSQPEFPPAGGATDAVLAHIEASLDEIQHRHRLEQ